MLILESHPLILIELRSKVVAFVEHLLKAKNNLDLYDAVAVSGHRLCRAISALPTKEALAIELIHACEAIRKS